MTEEQRVKFNALCVDYRMAGEGRAQDPYDDLRDYVETLIDEAVKDAINAQNSDKTE